MAINPSTEKIRNPPKKLVPLLNSVNNIESLYKSRKISKNELLLKSNYDAWYGCRVVREVYINILNASAQKPATWLYVFKFF